MDTDESMLESWEDFHKDIIKIQAFVRGMIVRRQLEEIQSLYEKIVRDIDGEDTQVEWTERLTGKPTVKRIRSASLNCQENKRETKQDSMIAEHRSVRSVARTAQRNYTSTSNCVRVPLKHKSERRVDGCGHNGCTIDISEGGGNTEVDLRVFDIPERDCASKSQDSKLNSAQDLCASKQADYKVVSEDIQAPHPEDIKGKQSESGPESGDFLFLFESDGAKNGSNIVSEGPNGQLLNYGDNLVTRDTPTCLGGLNSNGESQLVCTGVQTEDPTNQIEALQAQSPDIVGLGSMNNVENDQFDPALEKISEIQIITTEREPGLSVPIGVAEEGEDKPGDTQHKDNSLAKHGASGEADVNESQPTIDEHPAEPQTAKEGTQCDEVSEPGPDADCVNCQQTMSDELVTEPQIEPSAELGSGDDFPTDRTSLLELKNSLVMELLWVQQAIVSRKNYLQMRQEVS